MKTIDVKKLTDKQLEKLFNDVNDEIVARLMDRDQIDLKRKINADKLDIRVRIWYDMPLDEYGPYYSFYLNGDRCFYYDLDEDEREIAISLIPKGFSEAMENAYEFRGSMDEAIALLTKVGITDIVNDLDNENS